MPPPLSCPPPYPAAGSEFGFCCYVLGVQSSGFAVTVWGFGFRGLEFRVRSLDYAVTVWGFGFRGLKFGVGG